MKTKRTMNALNASHSITLRTVALGALLVLSSPIDAWCNKKEVPVDVELPAVPPATASTKPFSFDEPDPRRLITPIEAKLDETAPTTYLIGIGSDLSPEQATSVQSGILGLLTKSFCHPDDRMEVFQSGELRRIASFVNHERVPTSDCSDTWAKFRLTKNANAIGQLNRSFAEMKAAKNDGSASLDLPELIHFISQEFHEHSVRNRVLILMGSAVELSPEVNFLATSYPTIGMLRAEFSPFSTRGMGARLGNISTHFVFLNSFRRESHRRGMENFLSGFFLTQGSPLLTFSRDTDLASRVRAKGLPSIPAFVDDLNPGYISVEPADLFGQEGGSNVPSSLGRGSFLIGLKWNDPAVDLDLHVELRAKATGASEGKKLSFRSPSASFGSFRKEPGNGWEVVVVNRDEYSPQDVAVAVNHFGGGSKSGVTAELRVSYAGTLFTREVSFPAGQGNGGKPSSPNHWRQVDVGTMVASRR